MMENVEKTMKEDIQRGFSSREIISKYHIPVFQYKEIKDSMQIQETHNYTKESMLEIEGYRHKQNVSFPGLIFWLYLLKLLSKPEEITDLLSPE